MIKRKSGVVSSPTTTFGSTDTDGVVFKMDIATSIHRVDNSLRLDYYKIKIIYVELDFITTTLNKTLLMMVLYSMSRQNLTL